MVGKKFCAALCGFSMFWAAPQCKAGFTSAMLKISGVGNIIVGGCGVVVGILGSTAGAAVGAGAGGAQGAAAGAFAGVVEIGSGIIDILLGAANLGLAYVVDDNDTNKEKIKELENKVEMLSRR